MKVRILVKIVDNGKEGVHLSFFRPVWSLLHAAENKEDAIEVARQLCIKNIDNNGRPWVDYWKTRGEGINCPEGFVKLPIDLWCCKLTKKECTLQAMVKIEDEEEFRHGCHADDNKKEQILNTIRAGKYDGFHHVPGRYLCVACEKKNGSKKSESYNYHLPLEFGELDLAIGKSYEETLLLLAKSGKSSNYVSSPLCASCCYQEAVNIDAALADQLKVLDFDIQFR